MVVAAFTFFSFKSTTGPSWFPGKSSRLLLLVFLIIHCYSYSFIFRSSFTIMKLFVKCVVVLL